MCTLMQMADGGKKATATLGRGARYVPGAAFLCRGCLDVDGEATRRVPRETDVLRSLSLRGRREQKNIE